MSRIRLLFALWMAVLPFLTGVHAQIGDAEPFDMEKDLLLAHFDCKTDVDDLHSVAALATLLSHPDYHAIQAYAVAGAYGIQEGLYVPANQLFEAAFPGRWSDAHADFGRALREVYAVVTETLDAGGDIWIPEAGQSDFSAALLQEVRKGRPSVDTRQRIHIVQHSTWNEEVTSAESLAFARQFSDYHKIPDGNVTGNGTPGFRSDQIIKWEHSIEDPNLLHIWRLAIDIGNQYNGVDGRYLNTSVAAGGLDFSDVSETCWILGLADIADAEAFMDRFAH